MSHLLAEVKQSDSIYMPIPARITAVSPLTSEEKLFTIELPHDLHLNHEPGQFVEVSVLGVGEAPISITSSPSRSNGSFEPVHPQSGRPDQRHSQHESGRHYRHSWSVWARFPGGTVPGQRHSLCMRRVGIWPRCARW
ncbi:MAG: hypothetical protein M5U34_15460 [Chloroflexi bacterium]|nr:hypothetical protein [Chloroflexota bacterium]